MDTAFAQDPAATADVAPVDAIVLAVVQVQGGRIGIDAAHVVQAIVVPRDMASVPRRAGGIVGVVSHGGTVVPVVDLQRWLAAGDASAPDPGDDALPPAADAAADARIVILSDRVHVVGLLVDAVIGLQRCAAAAVERLFHDERANELFAQAALVDAAQPPLVLLEPRRLAALAGVWCAAAKLDAPLRAATVVAGAAEARAPRTSTSLGVFRIGDALVGLCANDIGELARTPALRPPPFQHPGARGLCDWRGRLLPVVDLTTALQAMPDAASPPWMCVVRHGELALGVLVHEIFDLQSVDAGTLDAARPDDGGAATLVRGDVSIERGILQVLDTAALMVRCAESALSARRGAVDERASASHSAKPYMVFESAGVFAAEIDGVQEVVPLPESLRERLQARLPASLSWRGHVVPVRDVLAERGEGVAPGDVRQLIIVADGDRRIAVPIAGVRAMIPPNTATLSRLHVNGRGVDVVSTVSSEHRASYALIDLAVHVRRVEPLLRAA